MKVTGASGSKIINIYGKNSNRIQKNHKSSVKKDSLEISNVARSLSSLVDNEKNLISKKRLEEIKNQISKGTYNVDSKLIAKKMLDIMKGKDV
ncbi:flagellar biosynthesis anti-sigma factor FlgM [Clostridium aestuarii]|uniref:Negative regulator of flagellin synthesis n=1 Tax=Clostridium aestuarii TaxID=338193 RepID=A0ABT4D0S2_9CLOT|nr:flagellar biosynthesis anti-sigma factor FlgM [Clostridium aestuarii]MCY6483653.1 flagellar biosynthesis anti-sigma factor FlgM [Clostridium aestuarii]